MLTHPSRRVLEEVSVRAGLALAQKKFMQDVFPNGEDGVEDAEALEEEYAGLCAQVVRGLVSRGYAIGLVQKVRRCRDPRDLTNRKEGDKSVHLVRPLSCYFALPCEPDDLARSVLCFVCSCSHT